MADLHAAVKALLATDATLLAISGFNGVLDDDNVGGEGLKESDLRGGTALYLPTVYLNWTTETPISRGPQMGFGASSGDQGVSVFLEVFFYDEANYSDIETMRLRTTKLLHQQRVSIDTHYLYNFIWRGDVKRQFDDRLGGVRMERSRFEGVTIRRF